MSDIRFQALKGVAIRTQLTTIAALRLEVFRDWPYLYDGTLEYERQYLETYARCDHALAVLAWQGEQCVGVTTALPMPSAEPQMRKPFEQAGLDMAGTLYFGESVVLESHRGLGIGVAFFEHREAHASELGLKHCAFCAVDRPKQHPLKPAGYIPNDLFWSRRGYTRRAELSCHFDWLDRGEAAPTLHRLTYWSRSL